MQERGVQQACEECPASHRSFWGCTPGSAGRKHAGMPAHVNCLSSPLNALEILASIAILLASVVYIVAGAGKVCMTFLVI